jgi:CDP-glucose 4,6-dehydratase
MRDGFWKGRRVLVTGHTGFKGAWLCLWLQHLGARVSGLALPPANAHGAFAAMAPWADLDDHLTDIRDQTAVADVVARSQPEVLFHLAGQSQVGAAVRDPGATYHINVVGTANVLEAARRSPTLRAVVVVTSDKVYRHTGAGEPFTEDDPLGGADPYSASKACAELVVKAWRDADASESPAAATARAGNVIGGGDSAPERLVPDVFAALAAGQAVRLRAPEAHRPWQFVLDPLHGYLMLAELLVEQPAAAPVAVNYGPAGTASVAEVVERLHRLWGDGSWVSEPVPPYREQPVLRLDAGLAARVLGWRCQLDLDEALQWTVEWHRARQAGQDVRAVALDQIAAFEQHL